VSSEHLTAAATLIDAPPSYKLLMFGLGYHADSHGRVRTSLGELIDTTGLSERTIRTWIKHAEKAGRIVRVTAKPYHLRLL
jgi:hypothetical protein